MPAIRYSKSDRRQTFGVIALASAVVVLAAIRASIGLSFYDDSYYVVVALRFAHGARLFVDELSLQSLGEIVSVPFLKIYESYFGLTGVALFVRELYVALAAIAGLVLYRLVRRSARPAAAAVAVMLPLLALPYHLFAPTYNTVSQVCFTLSVVLGWASVRDRRQGLAAASGVLLALGTAAYPPLALAAVVLLSTFALMARKRTLVLAALGGAVLTGALIALLVLAGLSADDLRRTIAFAASNVVSIVSPLYKLRLALGRLGGALSSPWLWPMWALAVIGSISPLPKRLRAAALAAIPPAAALPGAILLARADVFSFGTATSSWMITLTAGLAVPAILWASRAGKKEYLRLIVHAAPFALTGLLTVAYVTNSSWNRGVGSIALAPLTLGLLLCWSTSIAEDAGPGLQWTAIVLSLLVAFGMLFANVFGDPLALSSRVLIAKGPYAGVTTSPERSRELQALTSAGARWVGPRTRVAFLGEREAYMAVGGVWDTPAVWMPPAASDRAAVEYYNRRGQTAQVVFVDQLAIAREGGYRDGPPHDPLLAYVLKNYRKAGTVANFGVFVRK